MEQAPADNRTFVDVIFRVWASFYDNPLQQKLYFGPIQDAVIQRLGSDPGQILDLGCGTGELMVKLAHVEPPPLGMDVSFEMLAKGHEKPRLGGRLAVADGHYLPLADQSVDVITCLISFQYYLEPLRALADMRRVLKPGGRLYLAALSTIVFESDALDGAMRRATQDLFRVYPPSGLKALMLEAGFDTVSHKLVRPFTRLFVAGRSA